MSTSYELWKNIEKLLSEKKIIKGSGEYNRLIAEYIKKTEEEEDEESSDDPTDIEEEKPPTWQLQSIAEIDLGIFDRNIARLKKEIDNPPSENFDTTALRLQIQLEEQLKELVKLEKRSAERWENIIGEYQEEIDKVNRYFETNIVEENDVNNIEDRLTKTNNVMKDCVKEFSKPYNQISKEVRENCIVELTRAISEFSGFTKSLERSLVIRRSQDVVARPPAPIANAMGVANEISDELANRAALVPIQPGYASSLFLVISKLFNLKGEQDLQVMQMQNAYNLQVMRENNAHEAELARIAAYVEANKDNANASVEAAKKYAEASKTHSEALAKIESAKSSATKEVGLANVSVAKYKITSDLAVRLIYIGGFAILIYIFKDQIVQGFYGLMAKAAIDATGISPSGTASAIYGAIQPYLPAISFSAGLAGAANLLKGATLVYGFG